MTDEQTHETSPGMPGRRALGAMESAVLRARAAQGGPPPSSPPQPSPPPNRDRDRLVTVPTGSAANPDVPARPDRWLITSVAVVGALVVVTAIALAVSLTGGGPTTAPLPSTAPAAIHPGAAPAPAKGLHRPGSTSGRSTNTSTTTPTSAAAGGPPVISSLTPSSGSAGQSVQVVGANFLSSSGQIVAMFNGQVAPTSCPAQNTCTVTVPPSLGGATAQVTITTASGTSNVVTFMYR